VRLKLRSVYSPGIPAEKKKRKSDLPARLGKCSENELKARLLISKN
jgi:hypothetical protein